MRTVHRLDRVVSGLMVLARTPESASQLSCQIREQGFQKEYLAVVHGCPQEPEGIFRDLLRRDKAERKTYVTELPGKGVQEAVLTYRLLEQVGSLSQVRIRLQTGRTHQIRAQFSARGLPWWGDRKYSLLDDGCPIALWSHSLAFCHPATGAPMTFRLDRPPRIPGPSFHNRLFDAKESAVSRGNLPAAQQTPCLHMVFQSWPYTRFRTRASTAKARAIHLVREASSLSRFPVLDLDR